jgi:hypothetical protein
MLRREGKTMKRYAVLVVALLAFSLSAFAQTPTVGLSWTAPPAPVAPATTPPAAASYNVYRAPGACGSGIVFAKINTAAVTATTYTDSSAALTPNGTFCYQVTAVSASGIESVASNQAAATIPGPPAAPTGLVITSTT